MGNIEQKRFNVEFGPEEVETLKNNLNAAKDMLIRFNTLNTTALDLTVVPKDRDELYKLAYELRGQLEDARRRLGP